MTEAELTLLRSLAAADVVTFMPEDNTAGARARYEATVACLTEMQKAGWVELEVADDRKRVRGGHRQQARTTLAGRSGSG
jgi:thiazole synthase ThiGH ThiG subunit